MNNYRTEGSCRAESAYPQNHCFNPAFKYVPAAHTNIRETFERLRREAERTIEMQSNQDIRRQLGWFLK
jgi:hypothetical protein